MANPTREKLQVANINAFDRLFPKHIWLSKEKKAALERQELAKYTTEKSQAANVLLTLFLGPLGLFYANPNSAFGYILLLIIGAPLIMVAFPEVLSSQVSFTVFLGSYLFVAIPLTWLLSLISGCVAVSKHNKKVSANREIREQDRHVEQLEAIEKAKQAQKEIDKQETKQTDDTEPRSENPYY